MNLRIAKKVLKGGRSGRYRLAKVLRARDVYERRRGGLAVAFLSTDAVISSTTAEVFRLIGVRVQEALAEFKRIAIENAQRTMRGAGGA